MATSLTAPVPTATDRATGRDQDAVPLRGYVRQVRRHWRALAVCLVLALVGAGGYLWWNRDSYLAAAQVLVRDPADVATITGDRIGVPLSMDSEVQVLRSEDVAVLAAAGLHVSLAQVRARASVTIPPNSRLLRIEYRDSTRAGAIAGANEVAQDYLRVRKAQYDQERDRLVAGFTADIAAVTAMRSAAAKVAAAPHQSRPAQLSAGRRAGALQGQIDRLHYRVAQVQAVDTTAGRVTEAARTASGPGLANRLVSPATSLALAVMGYTLLLPLLARRRRVRTVRDASRLPDVELAMRAPRARSRRRRAATDRAMAARLWARVLLAGPSGPRVVVVLPADDGSAAADVALGLATASAAQGVPAGLVATGEPPWPVRSPAAGTGAEAGEPPTGEAIRVLGTATADGVTVIGLDRPEGMSVRSAIEEGLFRLGRRFDLIVVLAPPPGAPEHQALARAATVPIIVADRGRTRLNDVERTAAQARAVGASPPWVLIARSPRRRVARLLAAPAERPGPTRRKADARAVSGAGR